MPKFLLRHNIVRGEGKKPSKTAFFKLLNRYSVQIEKGPPTDNHDGCPFQKWKGCAFDTHTRCASLSMSNNKGGNFLMHYQAGCSGEGRGFAFFDFPTPHLD
jgi:hypothetical protein